ncbi:hypothetical protein NA56DRAFT_661434 [Hyaloscypha hepaticicola]|uniref:Uncharacterized protein n=1 Tax=Hyaloscypha hepaticicola TaxID=2082293 RepID=A0A2J6PWV8_9HELO|nr:hypothetical protein NA56DRAFT_661434 [Hyaloscypha hepaticicola]
MASTKATSAVAPMVDMSAPTLDISPNTSTSFPKTQRSYDDDWTSSPHHPALITRTLPPGTPEQCTLSPACPTTITTTPWVKPPQLASGARLSSVLHQGEMQVPVDHKQSSEDCASENATLRGSKPTRTKGVMSTSTAAGNVLGAGLSLAATVAFVVAVCRASFA